MEGFAKANDGPLVQQVGQIYDQIKQATTQSDLDKAQKLVSNEKSADAANLLPCEELTEQLCPLLKEGAVVKTALVVALLGTDHKAHGVLVCVNQGSRQP